MLCVSCSMHTPASLSSCGACVGGHTATVPRLTPLPALSSNSTNVQVPCGAGGGPDRRQFRGATCAPAPHARRGAAAPLADDARAARPGRWAPGWPPPVMCSAAKSPLAGRRTQLRAAAELHAFTKLSAGASAVLSGGSAGPQQLRGPCAHAVERGTATRIGMDPYPKPYPTAQPGPRTCALNVCAECTVVQLGGFCRHGSLP